MKKQRIYLDTSVFGGLFDEEFKEFTEPLFDRIDKNEFSIIFSNVTRDELSSAPEKIRQRAESLPEISTEFVKSDIESAKLAKRYIDEYVVGKTSYADCLHIAIATIHNADILVSWNFKHIVNVVKIIGYNSVNMAEGYKQIDIRSPRELLKYED
ncbi:PIN domain-containing protein [Cyclobacterium plantarum]|uniref:Type II toxin-antitoxin system VapC family toxin n=1 Tax=Cyclobacterium plantarum TaxID=2716263 RepID=A0ABX0H366_9BACT|nr:PIN domain-containing protein [Cyclobacterium plantarum]NHE56049.1 type II toxin-antitoxin system VapC family toxin [Cyclobacterium plantarum]